MTEVEIKKILNGIKADKASLPTRYLYDNLGGILFEAITELPKYNATRDELDIFRDKLDEIAEVLPDNACLIDLGAGSCRKAAHVIPSLQPSRYIAVDLPSDFFVQSVSSLENKFPHLTVNSLSLDFSQGFKVEQVRKLQGKNSNQEPLVYFYPGSTVGNFNPDESMKFLKDLSADGILIGVDLIKPPEVLLAAYNDKLGVTAAFNRNALLHLNRDLGTNFDVELWGHEAIFNDEKSRIEMHLVSLENQIVESSHGEILFRKGQTIHTENSYKYTVDSFKAILDSAGYNNLNSFVHSSERYAMFTATKDL
ncbi:MAG: L-histidine N(alpha)-methyltransferase [Betaproteobacteria bacterium TMED156]|nr:MAG: L-histidine N(alpha)-methyltransferase [Betaproteobacteria bacterium TMED156]